MGLLDQVKKAFGTVGEQVTYSSKKPQGVYFTNNFEVKAKQWRLSEKDALDVYYHGQEVKPGMKARKYNGYELFIYYTEQDHWPAVYFNYLEAGHSLILR